MKKKGTEYIAEIKNADGTIVRKTFSEESECREYENRRTKEEAEIIRERRKNMDPSGAELAQEEATEKAEAAVPKTTKKEVEEAFENAKPLVMRVHIDFIDEILGTAAGSKDIHGDYIASKAPDAMTKEEEIETFGEDEFRAKGKTVFPRDDKGNPIFWNYQWKGFFKSAASALNKLPGTQSYKIRTRFKKEIDLGIFPFADASNKGNRAIVIHTDESIGECQRPLRAQTMQGERVAIADSESIAPGAWCEFDIYMLNPKNKKLVEEWLDYGALNGMGQWRNSGKGAFTWREI